MSDMEAVSQDELEALARRYVWWQTPEHTLDAPEVLLRQILRLGTTDDYLMAREHWGEEKLKDALITSPAGALDERSWVFWHRQYDLPLTPPARRSFT